MDIISVNVAVEPVVCSNPSCGATADPVIQSASNQLVGIIPDGAELVANRVGLPDGWVQQILHGGQESVQTLCPDCSGVVTSATTTALASVTLVVPSPPVKVEGTE